MKTIQTLFSTQMLTRGVREAHQANNLFNPEIGRGLTHGPQPRDGNIVSEEQLDHLTTREKEVLQLIAEGKANKVAASELSISCKTVEKHRASLTEKLGIYGTAALTHYAIATGIVQCNPWQCGSK